MKSRTWLGLLVCALVAACDGSDDSDPDSIVPDVTEDSEGDTPNQDATDGDTPEPDVGDVAPDTEDTALPDITEPDSADGDGEVLDDTGPDTNGCVDEDDDGAFAGCPTGTDCDDRNPAVSPTAPEIPGNRVDDDCDGQVDEAPTDPPARTARLSGRVVLAGTAGSEGVAGARVTVDGTTAVADLDGYFALTDLPAGVPVGVEVRGPAGEAVYSSLHRRLTLSPASDHTLDAVLLNGCVATLEIADADGVLLPGACGGVDRVVALTLPQNGVVDATGTPVTRVRAEIIVLPIASGGERSPDALRGFPGDMSGVEVGGSAVYIESFGAVEVRLVDPETGAPLQLAADATAELLFQAAGAALDGDLTTPIPAWSYDPETATWVEEGTTSLEVEPFSGALLHRLTVRHFTWWNADRVADRTCLTGRIVTAEGEPFAGVAVTTTGVDYLGTSMTVTRPDGTYEVFARQASDVTLAAARTVDRRTVESTRYIRTGAAATPCLALPDVVLDDAPLFACAQGRVLDGAGLPVSRAMVTNLSGRVTTSAFTNADGTYCLPLPPDTTVDLLVLGEVGAIPHRGLITGVTAAAGSGVCSDEPRTCVTLPDVEMRALGCIRGNVQSELGNTAGAFVRVDSGISPAYARTDGSGTWCATVETGQVLSVEAMASLGGVLRTGLQRSIDGPTGGGTCGEPSLCRNADIVLDSSSCIRGRVLPADGVTTGTRVTVTERDGDWRRSYAVPADGAFCLPAPGGREMELEFDAFGPGRRFSFRGVATTPLTAATCGGGDCATLGDVTLEGEAFTGCVRGRVRYAGRPYQERVNVDIGGASTFVRPDRAGAFCIPATSDTSIVLRDSQHRSECVRPPEIERTLTALPAGGCENPASCEDLGELDFADFCDAS